MGIFKLTTTQQAARRERLLREQNALLSGRPLPRAGWFRRTFMGATDQLPIPTPRPLTREQIQQWQIQQQAPTQGDIHLLHQRVAQLEQRVARLEGRRA